MTEQQVAEAILNIAHGMKQIADALADLAELLEERLPQEGEEG